MTSEGSLVRRDTRSGPAWKDYLGSGALILSWIIFNLPTLKWLEQGLQEISRFNLLMLVAGGVLLLVQGMRYRTALRFSATPVWNWLPVLLMLAGALGAIATRWFFNLDQLPILFSLVGTYGLLGLFLTAATWRQGLPVGLAIALLLPFGVQFSTGLGFPARILTAHVVEWILKTAHIAALSSETIIVLDTGIAHVDLPCSGLKSLWTGSLFLLAATWLEGRRFGLRWLAVFVANLAGLAIANVARVLTLVLLTQVLRQPVLAEALHTPLGIIAFISACSLGWLLLRWVPTSRRGSQAVSSLNSTAANQPVPAPRSRNASWQKSLLPFGLAACVLALSWVPQPGISSAVMPGFANLQLPTMQTEAIALTPIEQDFFANYSGVVAEKQRFQTNGLTGSILLVSSPTWQAHHAPELCLVASGDRIDQMIAHTFSHHLSARWISLDGGDRTAVYWFQSPQSTTDDFLVRLWQDATRQESRWTMVSILFDEFHTTDDPALTQFVEQVHRAIAQAS